MHQAPRSQCTLCSPLREKDFPGETAGPGAASRNKQTNDLETSCRTDIKRMLRKPNSRGLSEGRGNRLLLDLADQSSATK